MHKAYLILGSNIEPVINLRRGLELLREYAQVQAVSIPWETQAEGSDGPNFLNSAACVLTSMDADTLKWQTLRKIEDNLGRKRTANKNAPRTLDLDIIIFDDQVVDPKLWDRPFLAIPMAELLPDLIHPGCNKKLHEIADYFKEHNIAVPHPELSEMIR
jgi:2-amino-4-hydroxy-6-hydroxymethyldihydropteridine diphosphokinase